MNESCKMRLILTVSVSGKPFPLTEMIYFISARDNNKNRVYHKSDMKIAAEDKGELFTFYRQHY